MRIISEKSQSVKAKPDIAIQTECVQDAFAYPCNLIGRTARTSCVEKSESLHHVKKFSFLNP